MKNLIYLSLLLLTFTSCSSSKELESQNQNLNTRINVIQSEVNKLSSDNERLTTEVLDLEKSNADIANRLTKCNDENRKMSSIYNSYTSKIKKMRSELLAAFPNNLKDANFAIVEEDGRLIIRLPNRILYSSGSAEFNEEALLVIQKLSKIFRNNPELNLLVEGHTDDVPLRKGSKYEDNWDLSIARSVKIVRQLETYGVRPHRLTAAGRGYFVPLDRTVSDEARAKNRRTEIIIRPKIAEVLKAMSELN